MDDGDGQAGHDSGGQDDPNMHDDDPNDESRFIALARAAAAARISDAAARALGITSSQANAQNGLDNINNRIDPGTFLPPTAPDPTGGSSGSGAGGSGDGASSSSGSGGSTSVDEALRTYIDDFIAELDKTMPGDGTAETEARRLAQIAEQQQRYHEINNKDPVTDDIDSIDGYLRDYRIYNGESQMARNALRADLTASDVQNARISTVITGLSTAGRTTAELAPQTEHVLEISIVAHMLNNPTFMAKVEAALGPNYMALNNFNPLETLAQLAETLKQGPNLVGRVPKWFNDLKGGFFKGDKTLNPTVTAYLEEASALQGPWIRNLAANHPNPYVRFIYNELTQSRFAKGGWDQLTSTIWWEPISISGAPAVDSNTSSSSSKKS